MKFFSFSLHPSWIVILAGVSAALHVGKLPPAMPVLQQALGVSLVQSGLLLSTVQMAGMLLGLIVGLGADAWGLRRSMLRGLALLAVASWLGAFASSYPWLLMLRMLEGAGLLLAVMPGPGLIRRSLPLQQLSRRMGWWGSYMPLGTALAMLIGAWVLSWAPWSVWWMTLGTVSAFAWAAVWFGVPADPQVAMTEADRASTAGWMPRLHTTLRSVGPWLVALGFCVYSMQWMGIIGFLPTVYAQAGLNAAWAGALTALVAMANMIGNVGAGLLLQRGVPIYRVLTMGYLCMGLCATLAYVPWNGVPLAPLWLQFGAVVGFSALGGLIPGTLFTGAVQLAPSDSTVSTTVGFMQQWSSFGQFAGPPLLALLATVVGGWQWTWVASVLMSAMGCLIAWCMARRMHPA